MVKPRLTLSLLVWRISHGVSLTKVGINLIQVTTYKISLVREDEADFAHFPVI